MMRRRSMLLGLAIALSLPLRPTQAEVTPRDIYAVLEDYSIPFDGKAVQRAAVEAMLKAVDPRARILPAADVPRADPPTPPPRLEQWPEAIAYLQISGFTAAPPAGIATSAVDCLTEAARSAHSGVIIDLRGAGGADLESAHRLASVLVATNAPLYAVRDSRGRLAAGPAPQEGEPRAALPPIMVAVDSDTRDAAEVLAAVLKSQPRLMLIGGPTRGDLGLREPIRVPSGDALLLATRWVVRPDGTPFTTNGIRPDIEVTTYDRPPLPDNKNPLRRPLSEKSKQDRVLMERVTGDAVLGKAVDILLALKALGINAATTNTSDSTGQ